MEMPCIWILIKADNTWGPNKTEYSLAWELDQLNHTLDYI